MNWHDCILAIQANPSMKKLVEDTYIEPDLKKNCERFHVSAEFKETLSLINRFSASNSKRLLDLGAGNGISAVALTKEGFEVTAVEPDNSDMVGATAIEALKNQYAFSSLSVIRQTAENLDLKPNHFDVIYARQALHHAADLSQFVSKAFELLKPGGIFVTIRDHMVLDENDKAMFLKQHPLHRLYGGENAFTEDEYKAAFKRAGFMITKSLSHYDSVINYYPFTVQQIQSIPDPMKAKLSKFIGSAAQARWVQLIFKLGYELVKGPIYNEKDVIGRLRTYVLTKPVS